LKASKDILFNDENFETIEKAYLNFSKYEIFLGVYDYSEAV
jgi:hypothetical protein